MDILLLNWKDSKNPEKGGAEVITFELARRLVKDGNSVVLFTRSFQGCLSKETLEGITVIRRGNKFTVYLHAFLYYKRLKKKPDLVIDMINTLCWQTPFYVPSSKRIAYVNQLAREVLFFELPFPLSFIAYSLERFEYIPYKHTKFICYSESTKEDLAAFGISRKQIHVFPLGIDHRRYAYQREKAPYPLFVFVGRLVKMKRANVCIRAMRLVCDKFPQAKLVIIGTGPQETSLASLVIQERLEANVLFVKSNAFFLERNPSDEKVAYMERAWALLLPSIKEGWGMVVTEAAACGSPSIVSNVTGLKDSVLHSKTGIVLSSHPSEKELADAILKLIQNKSYRTHLSEGAHRWSKNFSWEKSYNAFKRIIG